MKTCRLLTFLGTEVKAAAVSKSVVMMSSLRLDMCPEWWHHAVGTVGCRCQQPVASNSPNPLPSCPGSCHT